MRGDYFGSLPKPWKMFCVPGHQIIGAGHIGAFKKLVVLSIACDLNRLLRPELQIRRGLQQSKIVCTSNQLGNVLQSDAMVNIKKILLPVDFPNPSLPVIHQAATLAHHFHSEVLLLHVVTPQSHEAGVPDSDPELARWDMLGEIQKQAQRMRDQSLAPELAGLSTEQLAFTGDPVTAIVQTAMQENASLIMMPSHGYNFSRFLLGSVTAKVLGGTEVPVWTGAHVEQPSLHEFAIHNVLCAIDLSPQSRKTASWAAEFAAEFGARLTLAYVTPSVEFWGPGGIYIDTAWQQALVVPARQQMAQLQQDLGIHAETFIGSGDLPKVLSQAATETKADLLIIGSRPYGSHLRTHTYSIICAVPVPILSL
jgi:nucleotide-binding universal stress UspA family protein